MLIVGDIVSRSVYENPDDKIYGTIIKIDSSRLATIKIFKVDLPNRTYMLGKHLFYGCKHLKLIRNSAEWEV